MKGAGAAVVGMWLAVGAGCAHEVLYLPVNIDAPERPVVRYAVPPESPRGEVYVTSFGFTELDAGGGRVVGALHARLAVSNGGPNGWGLDVRDQQLSAPGQPPLLPAFVNSDAGGGPLYGIPPGQSRLFDFYYVLPGALDTPQSLGSFTLTWRLLAGAEPVGQRTQFQRVEGDGAPYDDYPPFVEVGLGAGVGWWYGPFYPFAGPPLIRGYYYPPGRTRASGAWHGTVPGSSSVVRATPVGGGWRGRGRR